MSVVGGAVRLLLEAAATAAPNAGSGTPAPAAVEDLSAHDLPAPFKIGLAIAVVAVVAIAGAMSGLTLGLLSLDRLELELMLRTGSRKQQKLAARLLPMVADPHWVLSTLVIANTAAGMALPLCLDRLVNVAVALVLSTTAIVIFGEILPQAVCSRHGISVGGHAAPFVRALMWATAPVSWPIARALDWLLGKESPMLGKRQIRAFVDLHRQSAGLGGPLNDEEFHVIQGVLDLSTKTGARAMTPLEKVFMLSVDDVLDRAILERVLASGHSRLPVYRGARRGDIVGLVLVKELLGAVSLAPTGAPPIRVGTLRIRDLPALPAETRMSDLLNLFQTGHSHMALLMAEPGEPPPSTPRSDRDGSRSGGSRSSRSSDSSGSTHSGSSGGGTCSSSDGSRAGSDVEGPAVGSGGGGVRRSGGGDSEDAAAARTPSSGRVMRAASALLQRIGSLRPDGGGDRRRKKRRRRHQRRQKRCSEAAAAAAAADAVAATAAAAVDGGGKPGAAAAGIAATSNGGGGQVVIELPGSSGGSSLPSGGAPRAPGDIARPSPPRRRAPPAGAVTGPLGAAAVGTSGGGGGYRPGLAAISWQSAGEVCGAAGGLEPVGIITLEDVIEELMQEEIVDETDAFIDNAQTVRVNARVLAMSLPPALRRLLLASQQAQHAQQLQAGSQPQQQPQQQPPPPVAASQAPASLPGATPPPLGLSLLPGGVRPATVGGTAVRPASAGGVGARPASAGGSIGGTRPASSGGAGGALTNAAAAAAAAVTAAPRRSSDHRCSTDHRPSS